MADSGSPPSDTRIAGGPAFHPVSPVDPARDDCARAVNLDRRAAWARVEVVTSTTTESAGPGYAPPAIQKRQALAGLLRIIPSDPPVTVW